MLAPTARLLRLQWQLFFNTFKHARLGRKIALVTGWLVMLAVGISFGFLSWGFFRLVDSPQFRALYAGGGGVVEFEVFAAQLPLYMMSLAFMMGLLANVSTLLQTLYLSGDMEFLLAAPIPARAVFLSKLLQAVLPVIGMLLIFAGPALGGLGYAQGYRAGYYLLIPVLIALVVFSGSGVAAVVVMFIVRLFAPRRAAEAIALVGGLSVFLCSQSGQFAANADGGLLRGDRIAGLVGRSQALSAAWNPLAWPGRALVAWGTADWAAASLYTAATVACGLLIFWGTVLASEHLYLSGWSRVMVGGRRMRARRTAANGAAALARPERSFLPRPVSALIRKDLLLFRRDLRNLSQLILPIVMAVVWGISFGQSTSDESSVRGQLFGGFGLLMAVMMAWGFATRFGMGAFSLEGSRWWIIKTSPVRRGALLSAKYLVAFVPSTVLGLLFLTVLSLLTGRSLGRWALDGLVLALVMAALTSLMLAFGIWTAKFQWKDPREVQAGGWSGLLINLLSFGAIFFLLAVFQGLPPLLMALAGWEEWAAYAVGMACGIMVSLALGVVPLWIASGRVDRLGEGEGEEETGGRKAARRRE